MSDNYLEHHGILGQKWGIRRFQNKDGTYTNAGKKRRSGKPTHDQLIKSTNAKELYKNRDQLSDKELQDRLNRLRNEQALKQMSSTGKSVTNRILSKLGEKSAEQIATAVVGATVAVAIAKGKTAVGDFLGNWSLTDVGDVLGFFTTPWNP